MARTSGEDSKPGARRATALAAADKKRPGLRNTVRIIGGDWRGRRIRFPPVAALRPTPDRLRETLFNWLQGAVAGAGCLDLFAGSGALGLEALSRGARECVFVEREPAVAAALAATVTMLDDRRSALVTGDAFRFLAGAARPFDLVFLDPPFTRGWLPELCTLLEQRGWLAPRAFVYLEGAARDGAVALPASWQALRTTRAGEVQGLLARRAGEQTDET